MSNDIETEKTQSQQSAESQIEVHRKRSILQKLSILWTIVSVLFSIGFMFFGLFSKWGNTKYFFVLLSIVCAYIVIFIVFIWFLTKKDKTTLL